MARMIDLGLPLAAAAKTTAPAPPAKGWQFVTDFESVSEPGKTRTVKVNAATGEWGCDCPAWRFKKRDQPRGCKHTRLARELGLGPVAGVEVRRDPRQRVERIRFTAGLSSAPLRVPAPGVRRLIELD